MSIYFTHFPKILYDIEKTGNPTLVTDIIRRVKARDGIKQNSFMFDKYDIKSGDTPETVSYNVYGSTQYYWIILLTNDMKDRFYDWPLSDQQFEAFVNDKYSNPSGIHHYEKVQSSGAITGNGPDDYDHYIEVNSTEPNAISVSNYEYERRLQDQKRQINLIKNSYLQSFLSEFKRLVRK